MAHLQKTASCVIDIMLAYALAAAREDYITILYLGRYAALRIHECFRIDTAIASKAIKENALTIKGNGRLVRTVPHEKGCSADG